MIAFEMAKKTPLFKKNKYVIVFPFLCIIVLVLWLLHLSKYQTDYLGLPVVPCIDATRPVKQNYSFTLKIVIQNRVFPLDKAIGHDYGDCLRVIHTSDSSGKVYVVSNDNHQYTLDNFFKVWQKIFNQHTLLTYSQIPNGSIHVVVDNTQVASFEKTKLSAGEVITISYNTK